MKCRRICKPGDTLEMQIKVNRVRHPLASFQGEITVENQKTATAEEIKLAFDYFPVIDGESSITEKRVGSANGNGTHSSNDALEDNESLSSRLVDYSDKS